MYWLSAVPSVALVDTGGIEPPTVEDALPMTPYISANLHARVAAFTGGPVDCCFSGQSPTTIRFKPLLVFEGSQCRELSQGRSLISLLALNARLYVASGPFRVRTPPLAPLAGGDY